MKKICVVTGSRAEYGLLKLLIKKIIKSPILKLQLIVTGMHLSKKFGNTIKDINSDGYKIDSKINLLLNEDTPEAITKSMGIGMRGFAKTLFKLKPDLLLVLGDRYEIMIAVISAMIAKIPVAHLHGGEITEGAFDDMIRHSITKMSHLHFVATEKYKKRVIQLGEQPKRIFNVGSLAADYITSHKIIPFHKLEKDIKFKFLDKNILITFHPVTLEDNTSKKQINEIIYALQELKNTGLIFTMPNSDTDSNIIFKKIKKFCKNNSNAKFYKSLGQSRYISCLNYVDCVLGNSSSGIIEVPSFKKPTINIGERQSGRIKAKSVIDCKPEKLSIQKALKKAFSKKFQLSLSKVKNPYGKLGAGDEIIKILEKNKFENLIKKNFYDIF
jgi:GDP/UDP-N,N'-diacetylbacillosamine 2-epimerase (hydrolysing)